MSARAAAQILQRGAMFASRCSAQTADFSAAARTLLAPTARLGGAARRGVPPPALLLQRAATYHTSSALFSISTAVERELVHEREQTSDNGSALETPLGGWALSTEASSTVMRLSKTGPDGEKVEVVVNTVEQDDETFMGGEDEEGEEQEEADPEYSLTFRIECTKGDQTLRYTCSYVENDQAPPSIEHVAVVPPGGLNVEEQMTTYEGPAYAELDEGLQAAFAEHLTLLNVDAELGQYLCRLVYDKEQADYVTWLEKLRKWSKA